MILKNRIVLAFSSAGGLGYAPVAPGTFGTLAALPLWWLMADLTWPTFVVITLGIVLFSIWISAMAEVIYGEHDVGKIVIDEVAGMMVTVIGVPFRWPEVIAAFVLFRILDATKPPPIRWFDENVKGGLGVVIDDVVAGVIACLLLHAGRWALGGWL